MDKRFCIVQDGLDNDPELTPWVSSFEYPIKLQADAEKWMIESASDGEHFFWLDN